MPFYIAIYDWSLYSVSPGLTQAELEGDSHANDPSSTIYDPGATSWIDPPQTFTFNGGSSTLLEIDDDDPDFEDAYVETGGAQTLAQDVTINGTTYLAGSVVQNEFAMLDASGNEVWVVRIDGVNVGFSYPFGNDPTAGETFTPVTGRDGDASESGDGESSDEPYRGLICFTPGALIETPGGPRAVESLAIGDPVLTFDHGPQPIRWVSHRAVDFAAAPDTARPIEIKAGALAPGRPARDLVVSPQHRLLMRDRGMHRPRDVLVPAKALTGLRGVRVMKGKRRSAYLHLVLDRHELLLAEGVLTESCYLGRMAQAQMPRPDLRRLRRQFPRPGPVCGLDHTGTARPALSVRQTRDLLAAGKLGYRSHAAALRRVLARDHLVAMPWPVPPGLGEVRPRGCWTSPC